MTRDEVALDQYPSQRIVYKTHDNNKLKIKYKDKRN